MSKIKSGKTIKNEKEFKSEMGVSGTLFVSDEEIIGDVTSINLSKGIVSVSYIKTIGDNKKHFDVDVSFKNLCIGAEKTNG